MRKKIALGGLRSAPTNLLQKEMKKISGFAVLTMVIIIASLFIYLHPTAHAAFTKATTIQDQRFTELYFVNPATLPRSISPERASSFRFVISNNERADTDYTYRVTASSSLGEELLVQSTIRIQDADSRTIRVQLTPKQSDQSYTIRVELLGRTEQVQFRSES